MRIDQTVPRSTAAPAATSIPPSLLTILRVGAAACFIGHGAFGVLGKEAWLPFFTTFGIGTDAARVLMPMIGGVDIIIGVLVLVRPRPIYLAYMAVWALWTAALRPVAGQGAWEMVERAGNYGVPIALLLMCGSLRTWRNWMAVCRFRDADPARLGMVLRATTAALLLGHGALAVLGKPLLAGHLALIGFGDAQLVLLGWMEIALAGVVLVSRSAVLFAGVAAWKLGTESLFVLAGDSAWELVERGGSIAAPLAVAAILAAASRRAAPRMVRPRIAALALGGVALAICLPLAAYAPAPPADSPELDEWLRYGGLVIACRHGITETEPARDTPANRRGQRNLSRAGREQSAELGRVIRQLRIPVGRVVASPTYRTWDTAILAFQRADSSSALAPGAGGRNPDLAARRRLFYGPVPRGTNRVLVTHESVLLETVPGFEPGRRSVIGEGSCLVLEPGDGGGRMVAHLRPADWRRMLRS